MAASSPSAPDTRITGNSGYISRVIFRAERPSNSGSEWSARTSPKPPASRAATKSSLFSTRWISQSMPPSTRSALTSSVSNGSSSRWRMRSDWDTCITRASPRPLKGCRAASILPSRRRRRLVRDGPEEADVPDNVYEVFEAHRLDDVGVGAQVVAIGQISLLARRGEHHHRDPLQGRVGLQVVQHLEPV